MLCDFDENIKITGRSTAHSGLAFASKADTGAGFNTSRNVYRKGTFFFGPAGPATCFARVLDDLANTGAGRTGAFYGKEALLRTDFTHTRTRWTGRGFGPTVCASASTCITVNRCWDVDGFLAAGESFLKGDAQVVAQIRAAAGACTTATTALSAHEVTKQIIKHVGKGA